MDLIYLDIKSDEGSANCKQRPTCEAKHYRKVFTECDESDTVNRFFFE